MAHGGYGRRRVEERRPLGGRRSKGLGVDKKRPKSKSVSLKNLIRSTERLLRKDLPLEIRQAQEKKLEEFKKQQELQTRLALEHKLRLRDRKIKFFERRKIERMIRRLEKQQRTSSDHVADGRFSEQLAKLREDLEYVRFFPKTEKYVSLFVGGDNPDIVEKRNKLRDQIKANLTAAAASGKDLEETASDDDALDLSDDDFFLSGSSSEAEADDELTDKSTREPASSASGKATSGMSSDEKNQRQISARVLMPPPRSLPPSRSRFVEKVELSTSSNTSNSRSGPSFRNLKSFNARRDHHSNLSSASDARKPRRKRRPKKKKQA